MPPSLNLLITQAMQQAPSADNSQPWHIDWQNNTLSIRYDIERVREKTFPANSPASLLSIGACIENLTQVTSAYNIQINYQIPKRLDLKNPVYCKCRLIPPDDDLKISDTPLALYHRHTNRMSYLSTSLPQPQIEVLKKMTLNTTHVKVISHHQTITQISKLVRLASEIRFRTQEINEWLGKSFRFGKQAELTNDGLDVATLDLPPGGALFLRFVSNWQRMKWLNRLGAYKLMSFIDSAPVKKAPALIAIIGKQGFQESLSAGQLLQHIWIDLNTQGIAVHPYYVISDQINRYQDGTIPEKLQEQAKQVYDEATRLFELGEEETLHMLLRVGYPKKKVKRSRRLPLEKICSGISFK